MIHLVRLGTHAEKEYLIKAYAWYDEVTINANLLEATSAATSFFLLGAAAHGRGFIIDPVTYAFALDPTYVLSGSPRSRPRRPKSTFASLGQKYGAPIDSNVGQRPISPQEFTPDVVASFAEAVLRYQADTVTHTLHANVDYLDEEPETPIQPSRLIAPYFYYDGDPEWLRVNGELARAAVGMSARFGLQVWPLLCFDSMLLDYREDIAALADAFTDINCPGYFLWATAFDETRATAGQIDGLRHLASRLCGTPGRPLLNMYGGYFSLLLKEHHMDGVSHGIGYGERRDVIPVTGGGMPPARYYLPAIHDEISIDDLFRLAAGMANDEFLHTICGCTICAHLIRSGGVQFLLDQFGATVRKLVQDTYRDVPAPSVFKLTKFHFLDARHQEVQSLQSVPLGTLVHRLSEAHDRFALQLGPQRLSYLRVWHRALT